MKQKILAVLLLFAVLFSIGMPAMAAADTITLEINGEIVTPAVDPVIENGTTLVPLRIVSEHLGAEVIWYGDTREISIKNADTEIFLTVDSKAVTVNGVKKQMLLAPKIMDSTTMVPIRFVSENLGVFVNWDNDTRTVQISETGIFEVPDITYPEPEKETLYDELIVQFIDVGQADAAFITCGNEAMLIDGGNVGDSQKIYSILKNSGYDNLKAIIVSHAHEDHCGGIASALSACTADVVYAPVTSYDSKAFTNITKKTALTVPKPGETFTLGSAVVEILGPVKQYEEPNNTSIVCKITNGNDSFLFTGDMELEAEQDLVNSGADLSADVLKVGHHGSDTSTGYIFLREVMPEYGIISVGEDNSYGHPNDGALSKLRDADVNIFRTDLQGDIYVTSTGNGISVKTAKNPNTNVFVPGDSSESLKSENTASQTGIEPGSYIGNVNSKVFHYDNCRSLPKEKNRVYFDSRSEAVDMGYKSCGNCNP